MDAQAVLFKHSSFFVRYKACRVAKTDAYAIFHVIFWQVPVAMGFRYIIHINNPFTFLEYSKKNCWHEGSFFKISNFVLKTLFWIKSFKKLFSHEKIYFLLGLCPSQWVTFVRLKNTVAWRFLVSDNSGLSVG